MIRLKTAHCLKQKFDLPFSANEIASQINVSKTLARLRLPYHLIPVTEKTCISNDWFDYIERKSHHTTVQLHPAPFCATVLNDILVGHSLIQRILHHHTNFQSSVVDFSSPNVAKPFHLGHLRSTLIGAFVCNVLSASNVDCVCLNYLGDWGLQFGYILSQADRCNEILDNSQLCDSAKLVSLAAIYARANECPDARRSAQQLFLRLELGQRHLHDLWFRCQQLSIGTLRRFYQWLGIRFDTIDCESMYDSERCRHLLRQLFGPELTSGDWLFRDQRALMFAQTSSNKHAVLLRGDGTATYLLRDIAAALDRFTRYSNCVQLVYVTDRHQAQHFASVANFFHRLSGAELPTSSITHIACGRVLGMSTRTNSAVHLSTFIEQTQDRVRQARADSANTRYGVSSDSDHRVTRCLSHAALVINDFRRRRVRDYAFCWEEALRQTGASGIQLQYLHCRLHNLELVCVQAHGPQVVVEHVLAEQLWQHLPVAHTSELIACLAMFDEQLSSSCVHYEPSVLVDYLFNLMRLTNRALRVVNVKHQPFDSAVARLALFRAVRILLADSLNLLGIEPLLFM